MATITNAEFEAGFEELARSLPPLRRPIIRLADSRRATAGLCSCCDGTAIGWSRSDRRDTDIDGLTLAVRYCAAHESAAETGMAALTASDVARLIRRDRPRRARAARIRAQRLLRVGSESASRASADMRGASSLTHTYRLLGGYAALRADAYERLAAALERAV